MSSSPKQSTGAGLNPAMVYRPLTPPAGSYLRVDESEDPKFKFRVRVAWIARVVLASLTLSSIITFIARGHLGRGSSFVVPLFTELWFVLIWQVVHLGRRGGEKGCLPRISVQIGDAGCVLGGEGDGERDGGSGWLGRGFGGFVDLAFGVTVITFGVAIAGEYKGYRYDYGRYETSQAGFVLAIFAGSLMVIVSVLSLFKVYHTMAIEFALYGNGDQQPITLGRPETDVSSRRDPVSISA